VQNIPLAIISNGMPPYRPEAWGRPLYDPVLAFLRRRAHRRAFAHAACVGFTSNYIRELMTQRLGITPRHARVFDNGLPEEWIERARRPLPDYAGRPMEIISVSSISPYKRQELVVRAMPELVKRPGMGELVYRIVGHHYSDAYIEGLKKMAADLGVGKQVVFEGRLPDQRMQELLQRARAFVLMSVCESFGIPAIEAMSLGTPVVTSDCCAMPEVCGKGAILSPVDDVRALAENIYRVLSDSETAEQLRRAGAENCLRFSWAKTAEQMASEFERIVAEGG
jgi:glycosyltransferase involved in cell wall biosynthesis